MFKHSNLNIALFDIKLHSPHKDLILVKGNESESDPIPFEGSVKLSIPQDIHVKKIKLNLTGEFNVEFFERMPSGMISDQVYDKLCVLRVEWNNLLTDEEGEIKFGNYGDKFVKMHKLHDIIKKSHSKGHGHRLSLSTSFTDIQEADRSGSLERPSYFRTKSQPSLDKIGLSGSLVKLPRSGVDGTPFKQYKTSSNNDYLLPQGNYRLPFKCYLPANTPETIEGLKCCSLLYKLECVIERGRFEKSIHTAKHIRVLRTLHQDSMNLTDTIDIDNNWPNKAQYSVGLNRRGIAIGSTITVKLMVIPIAKGLKLKGMSGVIVQRSHTAHSHGVSGDFEELIGKQTMPIPDPDTLSTDRWDVKSTFKVPSSLKELTQTCDLKNNIIQVKHRLRIAVQLKNQDGHVSELRANLPVCIYISPSTGYPVGRRFEISTQGYLTAHDEKQDILFRKTRNDSGISSTPHSPEASSADNGDIDEIDSNVLDRTDNAPPMYQQHVFDKIFDISSPQSPLEQLRMQSNDSTPLNSLPGSMVNITSYFDIPKEVESSVTSPIKSPTFDVMSLSKVPSYTQAIDENDDDENELAPTYDDENKITPFSTSSIPIPINNNLRYQSRTTSPMTSKSFLSLNLPKSRRVSPSHSLSTSPQPKTPTPGSPNTTMQNTPIKSPHSMKLNTKFLHKKKK
mmetsp:Transcript_540/g.608  ORF Transcript_540/g.608 Transcript_540/m.608 type:complete len:678 (+) Transcript_540:1733-3766(+)